MHFNSGVNHKASNRSN